MPQWPATLPPLTEISGFNERPPKNTLRTQMDAGPAKVRRRFTAGERKLGGRMLMDADQIEILDSFHVNDLASGSLKFDGIHPRTGAAAVLRFAAEPDWTHLSGPYYTVTLQLEILP
jgi:hypothetical protein